MPQITEVERRKSALSQELTGEIAYAESKAIANHRLSLGFMVLALGCSIAAAITGIFFEISSRIVGGIALLPALIAYIAVNLKLEEKSNWHYRKSHALQAVRSRLLFQQPESPTVDNIAAIASDRDRVNQDMLRQWNETLKLNWSGMMTHQNPTQSNEPSAGPTGYHP